jgi:hypothetical protein
VESRQLPSHAMKPFAQPPSAPSAASRALASRPSESAVASRPSLLDPELLLSLDTEPLLDHEPLPLLDPESARLLDPASAPVDSEPPLSLPPSSGFGTSGNPTRPAQAATGKADTATRRRASFLIAQNCLLRTIHPPPGTTLGTTSVLAAAGRPGACPVVKKSKAPPASSAPPAMNPTVEIVLSVIPVE